MNIVEPILFQCRLNPAGLAICTPGSALAALTYGELEKAIHNVARTALMRGLAPRMTVLVAVREPTLHAVLALGLLRLGLVVTSEELQQPPAGPAIDAVLVDQSHRAWLGHNVLVTDPSWTEGDDAPPDYDRLHPGSDEDLCRVSLTSGSTGVAKAVALSHGMLHARMNCDLFNYGTRFLQAVRSYCDYAVGSSTGFRCLLSDLWRGSTIYFLGDDRAAMLEAFDRDAIQGMKVGPYGLGQFVQAFDDDPALQCRLEYISYGGGLLPKPLIERVHARLCPHLYQVYGSVEAGVTTCDWASTLMPVPGAVGHGVPDVTVEIADADGQPLPAGREGKVRIRAPGMAHGYLLDEAASAEVFRDGFFHPGDLGYLTDDGMLVLVGREKTILNIGGYKLRPEIIEDVLTNFYGVEQAAVFTVPDASGLDAPWALIVSRVPLNEAALRTHCTGHLVDASVPARFIVVDAIPRSRNGKIERHRLRDLAVATLRADAAGSVGPS
jgi:acyl-CoA synthetase (AMP-forming)/AMP-acid ligase II